MDRLHHVCFVAGGDRPAWIQPAEHTYRPRCAHYAWKILEMNQAQINAMYLPYGKPEGRLVEQYVPPKERA